MKIFLAFIFSFICQQVFSQEFALKRLESSPRHHEWADVEHDGRTVHCFVVYPEKRTKTPVIIVIHENRGLTDWVRSFADQIAEAGYLAIAPDFLSGFSENASRTSEFENEDVARNAIYKLENRQVMADLAAVQAYAEKIPSSNGKTAVIGFCWGGAQAFDFATRNKNIDAALVFYGSTPTDPTAIKNISAPVYGFYGENDQRINAGIPGVEKLMKQAGKMYEYVIYKGAGHAYMRQGDDPAANQASKDASMKSWERIKSILKKI